MPLVQVLFNKSDVRGTDVTIGPLHGVREDCFESQAQFDLTDLRLAGRTRAVPASRLRARPLRSTVASPSGSSSSSASCARWPAIRIGRSRSTRSSRSADATSCPIPRRRCRRPPIVRALSVSSRRRPGSTRTARPSAGAGPPRAMRRWPRPCASARISCTAVASRLATWSRSAASRVSVWSPACSARWPPAASRCRSTAACRLRECGRWPRAAACDGPSSPGPARSMPTAPMPAVRSSGWIRLRAGPSTRRRRPWGTVRRLHAPIWIPSRAPTSSSRRAAPASRRASSATIAASRTSSTGSARRSASGPAIAWPRSRRGRSTRCCARSSFRSPAARRCACPKRTTSPSHRPRSRGSSRERVTVAHVVPSIARLWLDTRRRRTPGGAAMALLRGRAAVRRPRGAMARSGAGRDDRQSVRPDRNVHGQVRLPGAGRTGPRHPADRSGAAGLAGARARAVGCGLRRRRAGRDRHPHAVRHQGLPAGVASVGSRSVPGEPVSGRSGRHPVLHRRSRPLPARRHARDSRAARRPGEGARRPHRAAGDRGGARVASAGPGVCRHLAARSGWRTRAGRLRRGARGPPRTICGRI